MKPFDANEIIAIELQIQAVTVAVNKLYLDGVDATVSRDLLGTLCVNVQVSAQRLARLAIELARQNNFKLAPLSDAVRNQTWSTRSNLAAKR